MKIIIGTAGWNPAYPGSTCTDPIATKQACLDHGFTHFDTSPAYGNAETVLGRSEGTIYTKVSDGPWESLRALGAVPLFLWHHAQPGQPIPSWCSGASLYAADLGKWMNGTPGSGVPKGIVQIDWSPIHRQAANLFEKPGYEIHLRSILLGGRLITGRVDPTAQASTDAFLKIAKALSMTPYDLALRLALAQPVDGLVIGINTPEEAAQLRVSLDASPRDLTPYQSLLNLIPSCPVDLRTWTSSPSPQTVTEIVTSSTTSFASVSPSQTTISVIPNSQNMPSTALSSNNDPTPSGTGSKRKGKRQGPRT